MAKYCIFFLLKSDFSKFYEPPFLHQKERSYPIILWEKCINSSYIHGMALVESDSSGL